MEVLAARRGGVPLVCGHRGARGHAPENTMAAFRAGLELGADLLELDVRLSRDGEVVVIHDPILDRTTDGHGWVHERSLAELRACDAGAWHSPAFAGERIPTLAEVAAWAKDRIGLNIEVKTVPEGAGDLAARVADICRQAGITERSIVISFDHAAIARVKAREPGLACAVNFTGRPADPLAAARAAHADVLNVQSAFVSRELCELAHANGLGVHCFEDDPGRAATLAGMGIDILDADHPAAVKAAVRRVLSAPGAEGRRVLRFAHRGAWSRQPGGPRENTLAAFAAAAGGWDGVELDVHRTADGRLPVVHDVIVQGRAIGEMTWDELHAAAPWVPELHEALRLCRDAGLRVNLEVKAGGDFYPGIEAQVLQTIQRHGWAQATILSSFDQKALLRVRELDSAIATAVLYTGRMLDPVGVARRCGAKGLHPEHQLLRAEDVAAMRAAGMWVATWTARGPAACARLAALGVDAVIGDPA